MKVLRFLGILTLVWTGACSSGSETTRSDTDEYTESMAVEHAGETPEATGAVKGTQVSGSDVVYASSGDREVQGYLARPEGTSKGAVIVIHEWWGLNDNIRNMTEQIAALGYTALAVDLYGGEVASDHEKARGLMEHAMSQPGPVKSNLQEAREFLVSNGAEKVAVLGWCFGGHWALQSALMMGDALDAVVIYYGRLITDQETLEAVDAPILGIFGEEDGGIPVESVKAFEASLDALGKDADIHIYEGADHAFANPSGERYDEEAAEDAWDKTRAFLQLHMQ